MPQSSKNQSQTAERRAAPRDHDSEPPRPAPKPKRRRPRTWPYVVVFVAAWGAIFGAVFYSRFLSELPDVKSLMASGPSRDITILDDRGRLIARRGLTQGAVVDVRSLP